MPGEFGAHPGTFNFFGILNAARAIIIRNLIDAFPEFNRRCKFLNRFILSTFSEQFNAHLCL